MKNLLGDVGSLVQPILALVGGGMKTKEVLSTGLCASPEGIMFSFTLSWKPRISDTITKATNNSPWPDGLNLSHLFREVAAALA